MKDSVDLTLGAQVGDLREPHRERLQPGVSKLCECEREVDVILDTSFVHIYIIYIYICMVQCCWSPPRPGHGTWSSPPVVVEGALYLYSIADESIV